MGDTERPEEEDVVAWGLGSIKKKILLWESQEDVSKKGSRSKPVTQKPQAIEPAVKQTTKQTAVTKQTVVKSQTLSSITHRSTTKQTIEKSPITTTVEKQPKAHTQQQQTEPTPVVREESVVKHVLQENVARKKFVSKLDIALTQPTETETKIPSEKSPEVTTTALPLNESVPDVEAAEVVSTPVESASAEVEDDSIQIEALDKQPPKVIAEEPLQAPELVALVMQHEIPTVDQYDAIVHDAKDNLSEEEVEVIYNEITQNGVENFTEIQYTFPNCDTDLLDLETRSAMIGTSEEGFDDISSVESGRASRRATLGSDVELEIADNVSELELSVPEVTVTSASEQEDDVEEVVSEVEELSLQSVTERSISDAAVIAPTSTREYRKSVSYSKVKTNTYAAKIAALLYLRGINAKREFCLATSVDGAGLFADVVFKYKTDEDAWKTCYIQVRNKDVIFLTPEVLMDSTELFSLEESFESFREIRSKTSSMNEDKIFQGDFEDCSFLIHTNAIAAEKLMLRLRPAVADDVDKLLKSGGTDEGIINLHPESDKDIFQAHPEKRDFLRRLKILVGQPSEIDLDHVIKMELRTACSKYLSNVHIIYRFFIEAVQQWWTYDETFLTQRVNILDKAESILNVYNLTAKQKQLFKLPDVNFKEEYTASWNEEFRKGSSLLCIQTTAMTSKFSSTKLMQCLWNVEVEYIFTSLPALLLQAGEVVSEWMSGQKDLLVIVSESTEEHDELCEDICQVFAKKPGKRLVVLAPPFDSFCTNLSLKYGSSFDELYDPYDILQLDKESTDQILEREVRFQGCPIYLRCIISDDLEKTKNVLSSNNFDAILYTTTLNVGTEIVAVEAPFVPRSLQRRDIIDRRILTSDDFWGIIAVSNITVDELKKLIPSGKKVGRIDDPNSKDFRFLALDSVFPEEEYYKLCESRKDVHWFHNNDGVLIWRRSQRNLKSISRYIEDTVLTRTPENILDLEDRVVLVVADPKAGSTLLTTHLAVHTKLADPSLWVIQIHLDQVTTQIEKASSEDFNVVDFLALVSLDKDATELERDLLRFGVEEKGNVAVFLFGLEAIVPRYLRASLALLSCLLRTKISKLFITSQPSLKDMLESHLATFAYEVCPDDKMAVDTDA